MYTRTATEQAWLDYNGRRGITSSPDNSIARKAHTKGPTGQMEVKSFSLALWLYQRGYSPQRAVHKNGRAVFIFHDDAGEHVAGYLSACALLNDYERRARRTPLARLRDIGVNVVDAF